MAAFNGFNSFLLDLANGDQDMNAHVYKVMLTNVAPVATNTIKANLTDITAANGYTAGGTATTIATSQASGVLKVTASDVVFTASGGSIGPFRYIVLYNDTQTVPAKPLVAWWDYSSALTLNATETFTVDFDGANGIFQIA